MKTNRYIWLLLAAVGVCVGLWIAFNAGRASRVQSYRLAASKPDTLGERIIYTCSMHPQVMQNKPGACPVCQMKLVPLRKEPVSPGSPAPGEGASPTAAGERSRKIAYYWDPMMSPPYISKKPGKSPMGMDLIPVYEDEVASGLGVTIDPTVTQNIGIRVERAVEGALKDTIRTVGYFRTAEPNQYDVTLKVGGYIERLYADTEGILVAKDAPLFELYSPELLVAEEELVAAKGALEALPANADETVRLQSEALLENVKRKLELWNVPDGEIDRLLETGKTNRVVTFLSPATGFIVEKDVVAGASVMAGQKLLRIDDLSTVWLDAQVYEGQLPYVAVGRKATATVQGLANKSYAGDIIFIDPEVSPETRSASARIVFANPGFSLKPGMFASVELAIELSARSVHIPREAVIDTGKRQLVFVAHAGGRFEPRAVQVGAETSDGTVQILSGLSPGDTVVTSGQFLLDTESRTREAIEKMTQENLLKAPERSGPGDSPEKHKAHSH